MKQTQRPIRGVFERPPGSGVWWINYYDADGCRHREKVGRKSVAEQAYFQRQLEVREGKFRPPRLAGISFRELATLALADKESRGLSTRTVAKDRQRLAPINLAFGNLPADKLPPARIEAFLRERKDAGNCGSTANRYRSLVSSIFSFGVRSGTVRANPCLRVHRSRESESRIRFLEREEETALRAAIAKMSPQWEAEFDLALHTGIRRGEQFSLQWKNVSLERGIIAVRGKTGRRFVPLNSTARRAIERLWPLSNGSAFVCAEAKREGQSDWRRWFEDACKKAKIEDFRWHDLRHTFASRLVMAGVDLRSVQELLGHKSILTTMKYAHLAPGHQKSNVEKLAHSGHQNGTGASTAPLPFASTAAHS